MKMFSKQFPIKRTNFHGHTTNTTGSNLFCQKSSFHSPPQKRLPLKNSKNMDLVFANIKTHLTNGIVETTEVPQWYPKYHIQKILGSYSTPCQPSS